MQRLVLALAALLTGLLVAGTIDRDSSVITEQRIAEINEQRSRAIVPVNLHPLGSTWVLQAGNDGNGKAIKNPRRRYSNAADLTDRKDYIP